MVITGCATPYRNDKSQQRARDGGVHTDSWTNTQAVRQGAQHPPGLHSLCTQMVNKTNGTNATDSAHRWTTLV